MELVVTCEASFRWHNGSSDAKVTALQQFNVQQQNKKHYNKKPVLIVILIETNEVSQSKSDQLKMS